MKDGQGREARYSTEHRTWRMSYDGKNELIQVLAVIRSDSTLVVWSGAGAVVFRFEDRRSLCNAPLATGQPNAQSDHCLRGARRFHSLLSAELVAANRRPTFMCACV